MVRNTKNTGKHTAPSKAEYEAYVGDLDTWVEDRELSFPRQMGIRIVVDLEGDDAVLLDRVVDALETDYVRFAKRAILDAARAAAESAPPRAAGGQRPRAAGGPGTAEPLSGPAPVGRRRTGLTLGRSRVGG